MSIVDLDKVDGAGIDKSDKDTVLLMISDHLDWEEEYEHLKLLQDKLNCYLDFIQSGQVKTCFPESSCTQYEIIIYLQYPMKERGKRYIDTIRPQLKEHNILLEIQSKE